jgi:hypothetical protein
VGSSPTVSTALRAGTVADPYSKLCLLFQFTTSYQLFTFKELWYRPCLIFIRNSLFLIFLPYFVRLSLYVLRSRFIYRESEDVTSSTLLKNSVNLRFVSVTLSSLVDLISLRFDIIAGPHSLMLGYLFVNRLIYL